jgi:hypothetical protein
LVESSVQDGPGESWKTANFDQGSERYENEIYNLSDYELYSTVGGPVTWNHQASSLTVEGSITLYDGIGYTGDNINLTYDVSNLTAIGWNDRVSSLKQGNSALELLFIKM